MSLLCLKFQAIKMIEYFAKKLITVPAPAMASTTWHEITLFFFFRKTKILFLFVCILCDTTPPLAAALVSHQREALYKLE